MNDFSTLTLFAMVCVATACTTGFFILIGAYLIAREVRAYVRALQANNDSVNKFVAAKQEEIRAMINNARPLGDVFRFPKGRGPNDGEGPKGSA